MVINIKKNKKMIYKISIFLLFVFSLSLISLNKDENTMPTNSNVLSNKKIEWGIKRKENHEQPDFGSENIKILKDNNGFAVGNKDKKNIYLTFDEGYEAGYTPEILRVLKDNNVNATFFITAHYLNTQPELIKQMIDEGHIVGNHTVNHKSMPSLTKEEITKEVMDLHKAIYDKFGYEMKYIRPPKGELSEYSINVTNSLGYKTIMWSFAYEDWDENKQPDEAKSKQKILDNVHNGEIMLLHGNSKTNTNILEEVIKEIKEMGYEFKSLNELN